MIAILNNTVFIGDIEPPGRLTNATMLILNIESEESTRKKSIREVLEEQRQYFLDGQTIIVARTKEETDYPALDAVKLPFGFTFSASEVPPLNSMHGRVTALHESAVKTRDSACQYLAEHTNSTLSTFKSVLTTKKQDEQAWMQNWANAIAKIKAIYE
jgi:hypothetical protein